MTTSIILNLKPLLDQLRKRIRVYVVTDGLLVGIAFSITIFWLALALDFLPVLLGANEMPLGARRLLLAFAFVGLGVIAYRQILRRARVPILDRQLALLIERQHPHLNERLLTAVEQDTAEGAYGARMLERTRESLSPLLETVELARIFDFRPLRRRLVIATLMLVSLAVLLLLAGDILTTAWRRLVLLQDLPYPRRTHFDVQGFQDGQLTVARGSDVTMVVLADATRATPPPRVCTITYHLPDRSRGRVNMSRQGSPVDGRQEYVFSGKPFQNILADLRLDVRGNDYSVRDLRIRVVDSPQITSAQLKITLPAYTGLLPRTVPYRPGMAIPVGSDVRIELRANKPLVQAKLVDPASESFAPQSASPTSDSRVDTWSPRTEEPDAIEIDLPGLDSDVTFLVSLDDHDGITSSQPYPISLAVLPDRAPQIDVRLQGIGSAITPNARLPLQGTIRDDYGVAKVWIEMSRADEPTLSWPTSPLSGDRFADALDLAQQRRDGTIAVDLPFDSRLAVTVRATDRYDLDEEPHVGNGDIYELEVVRPEQLLSMLEARELGLRERLEQIVDEMQQMRDSLQRAVNPSTSTVPDTSGAEPEDAPSPSELAEQGASEREGGLNRLRVQRAGQHVERATQEVAGVAFAFEDIREELINNRIDSTDRQQRIKADIADPLHQIANERMAELSKRLALLENTWAKVDERQQSGIACLRLADDTILAMEQVLARMLDLESYHELLDLVRSLIEEQEQLERLTREEQRRQMLELIQSPTGEGG